MFPLYHQSSATTPWDNLVEPVEQGVVVCSCEAVEGCLEVVEVPSSIVERLAGQKCGPSTTPNRSWQVEVGLHTEQVRALTVGSSVG